MTHRSFLLFLFLLCTCMHPGAAVDSNEYQQRRAALAGDDSAGRYTLSQWCRQHGMMTEYRSLLEEVISLDPDHAEARRQLRYQRVDGGWYKGAELQEKLGRVLHEGKWIPKEDKEKIDQGLIFFKNKWMNQEEYYTARGFVQHRGKWITKSRVKRLESRRARLQKLTSQRADWANAWQVRTRYFDLKTNTSHQIADEIADAIDASYETLRKVYSVRGGGSRIPVDVFATFEQFAAASAAEGYQLRNRNILGYFWWRGGKSGIRCYFNGSLEETLKTLYHEIAHLSLHRKVRGPTPIWSNEGLAVFFEDLYRTKQGFDLQTIPWHRLWAMRRMLDKNPAGPPLAALIDIGRDGYSIEYYPQGWALIHFLLFGENGKYRGRFNRYYSLLEKDPGRLSNRELFVRAFGVEPEALQEAWVAHIQQIEPESVQDFIGASRTAARYKLDLRQARDFARQAIALDDKEWQAHAALADAYLLSAQLAAKRGDMADLIQEALQAYEAAAEAGRFTTLRKRRGAGNFERIQLHNAWATAHIYAGNYETAYDMLEDVLDVDETSSGAYRALALMQIIATDDNVRDLEQAAEDIQTADDFGLSHRNTFVRALLAQAHGDQSQAQRFLKQASEGDRFGVGRALYPALLKKYGRKNK